MTTERQPATQELDAPAPALDQSEITDETSAEQKALEARMLAGEEVDLEPGEAPETESEAPAEAPAVSQTPTPVEPVAEVPPAEPPKPPRLEDSPEWRKAQGAWQRKVDAALKQASEAQTKLDAFNLDAEVETRLRRQEQRLAVQYGEEDARKIVRDAENVQAVKSNIETDQRLKQAQENERQYQAVTRQSLLGQFIEKTVVDNGLDAEDAQALMTFVIPQALNDNDAFIAVGNAIGAQAQRLGTLKKSTTVSQQAKRNLVPAETSATRPETGASPGSAPLTHDQMLARVRVKPSSQWTEKEHEFMRTGRVR